MFLEDNKNPIHFNNYYYYFLNVLVRQKDVKVDCSLDKILCNNVAASNIYVDLKSCFICI